MDTQYTFTWGFIFAGLFVGSIVIINFCMCIEFLNKKCKKKISKFKPLNLKDFI